MNEPENNLNPEMGEPGVMPNRQAADIDVEDAQPAVFQLVNIEQHPPELIRLILLSGILDPNDSNMIRASHVCRVNRRWNAVARRIANPTRFEALCFVDNLATFNFAELKDRMFGQFNLDNLFKIRLKPGVRGLDVGLLADYYSGVSRLIINERHLSLVPHLADQITHLALTNEARSTAHKVDPSTVLNQLERLQRLDLSGHYIYYYRNMRPTLQRIEHLSASWNRFDISIRLPSGRPVREGAHPGYDDLANFLSPNCTRLWFGMLPISDLNEWQRRNPGWFSAITHLRIYSPTSNVDFGITDRWLNCILVHMRALQVLHIPNPFFLLTAERIRAIGRLAHLNDLQLHVAIFRADLLEAARDINPIAWTNIRTLKLFICVYGEPFHGNLAQARIEMARRNAELRHIPRLPGFMESLSAISPNVQHLTLEFAPRTHTDWFLPQFNIVQYRDSWPQLLSYEFSLKDVIKVAGERSRVGENFIPIA